MSEKKWINTKLKSLMEMLASNDGMIRQKARKSLVAFGKPAVSCLIQALANSTSDQVRWEAAKALGEIVDIKSIPPLVKALEDSDSDVAWLAAEALSKFKKNAWPLLLRALIKNGSDSVLLHRGVRHVLLNQKEDGFNDLLSTLMNALEPSAVPESAIIAANEILKRMKAET